LKLLFDQNLSPRLIQLLDVFFPNSRHVRDVGLASSSDDEVWKYAIEQQYTIVSKDSDFHQRSLLEGFPPKIVWIRRGNCSTSDIVKVMIESSEAISDFFEDEIAAFLVVE
jgi:predicted nuclease of predicted toxin-antitoxin system